jgi:hypothetical protein
MRQPGDIVPNQWPTLDPTGMLWYRFDDIQFAPPLDQFERPSGIGRLIVQRSTYKVLKVTPTGVWLSYGCGKRFCKAGAKRKFACATEAEAIESFKARKRRQIFILRSQLFRAEQSLELLREMICEQQAT